MTVLNNIEWDLDEEMDDISPENIDPYELDDPAGLYRDPDSDFTNYGEIIDC